jgi:hypothetical protein
MGAVSDLHIALGALAAILLLAIWAHGRWQEHRVVRRLRERLIAGVGDPLLTPEVRSEPLAGAPVSAAARGLAGLAGAMRIPARREPGPGGPAQEYRAPRALVGDGEDAGRGGAGLPAAGEGRPDAGDGGDYSPQAGSSEVLRLQSLHPSDWHEDPLLDCSLEIRCARAVDGVAVIEAVAPLATPDWPMPVHFVVWDARHQQWVLPDRFGYYTDALASVQLGGRAGALDAVSLGRFVHAVREIARVLDADVDLPDGPRVLAQAADLDQVCVRFDIRIALTVRPGPGAWTGPQVRSAVADLGWSPVSPQHWAMMDASGLARFHLQADSATPQALGLELDVPLAADAVGSLGEMVLQARTLAQSLAGLVVDDNGHPVDEGSMRGIQDQLARVVEEMRAAGIEPGGDRARRLYGGRN